MTPTAPARATRRLPAVAGAFYPAGAAQIRHQLGALLAAPRPLDLRPKALICPHAGTIYSGPIAASGYALLASVAAQIRRVVILGPAHRVPLSGLAAPSVDLFATPLGDIAVDREAIAAIRLLPQVIVDDAPHALEHSIEVQLPFLQLLLQEFTIVPLVVGDIAPEPVAEVIAALWGDDSTLIVVSSDLSHYLPYDDAQQADRGTCQAILAGAPVLRPTQACGARPVNGLLLAAARRGLKPTLLDLRNSGDTAGDRNRVVGYAAFAFTPG